MIHACKRCKMRTRAVMPEGEYIVCAFERSELFLSKVSTDDVCGLSGDDESVWEMLHPERRYCASCKWYAPEEGVCCNDQSEYCSDFWEEGCKKWEAIDG